MSEPTEGTTDFWTWLQAFASEFSWLLQVIAIIVIAWLLRWALLLTVKRIVRRVVNQVKDNHGAVDTQALFVSPLSQIRMAQRTRTIGTVLSNIITWVITVVALILLLDKLGFSITALVASAGVIGAALAFGAQNVIKDALNGLFLVFEDQLGVGDVVDVGPATGVVENVGIRGTQIRDVNGTLWFVRNGEILRVGNMSQGWSRAIIDLSVALDSDIDETQELLIGVADKLAKDPDWCNRIIENPELWGLESISSTSMIFRLVLKTRPTAKDAVARELRRRLKLALDDAGVHPLGLNSITLTGSEGSASVKSGLLPKTGPISKPKITKKRRSIQKITEIKSDHKAEDELGE